MASPTTVTLSEPEPGMAVLTLDDPHRGVNLLSEAVLAELGCHLDTLEQRDDLAGLVIRSGKPGVYIAGADLQELVALIDAGVERARAVCRFGQQLFRRLAACPFVTVAAIDGVCLGGGAELAIWCDRRIMTTDSKTEFGFPEVKLGLLPGWGGTARLPRVVGLANAVEMVTGGESLDAQVASRLGLADDVVSPDQLAHAALAMVRVEQRSRAFAQHRRRWAAALDWCEPEWAFLGATALAYLQTQTQGHYPAPFAALELLLSAAKVDVEQACRMETDAFVRLLGTPVNRALLNVFSLRDLNKKDPGVPPQVTAPRPIRRVGVIGAGIMGQGIAAANIQRKISVTLTDNSTAALTSGVQRVLAEVAYNRFVGGPDLQRALEFAPFVGSARSDAELAQCDLLVEAVVEDLGAKKELFARLEPLVRADTILASNTSTIPITKIAAELVHAERFCGIHFFNPVRRMQLVEVIRGKKTSDQTVATAVDYAKLLGKAPIVVGDSPGFLVNRLLSPYLGEALELLLSGAPLRDIERAATEFGMPMGPLTLFDVIGIDTALHAGRVMYDAFPDRVVASQLLTVMYKAGRLGQKSGAGFYAYPDRSGRGIPDPQVDQILASRRRAQQQFDQEQLTQRLFLPMLVEATRVLQEGLVRSVRDVDLGLIFGIGFPAFRGGLLFWADALGPRKVVELLKPYAALGKRYQPSDMLMEMARGGLKFYAESR